MREWTYFLLWAAVGACAAFGVLGIATIGIFFLIGGAVLAVIVAVFSKGRGISGVLFGAGVVVLFIAYLHRRGPGMVCTTDALMTSCEGYLNPWPFLAVGLMLAGLGVGVQALAARRVSGG